MNHNPSLKLHTLRLVTIVAETVLRDRITGRLLELGATGFTVTPSNGRGSRGIRSGDVPGEGVRIEAVVSPDVAVRILEEVSVQYFPAYAVIAWVAEVQVVRGGKYVRTDA
jgi:nitrogen regulatory protein P-II 2